MLCILEGTAPKPNFLHPLLITWFWAPSGDICSPYTAEGMVPYAIYAIPGE